MAMSKANQTMPAIHSIDHFTLEVPDLDEARRFFTAFGLEVEQSGNGIALQASDSDHIWGRMLPGPRKRLAYVCFNCFEEDYESLRDKLAKASVAPPYEAALYADGVWVFDADGNRVQVRIGPKTSPTAPRARPGASPRQAGERGVAAGRREADKIFPTRLSHILLFTPDVSSQVRFYEDLLGLRLSDRSGEIIAFLHGVHGSDHHLVAFAKSPAPGWHHSSWDVASVEEVGLGWMQMQAAGYARGWGLGRHVLGSNYFCYVQDPWGSFCEYSAGIDFVAAEQTWQAADHPVEDALYLWGPPPPTDFTRNSEAS